MDKLTVGRPKRVQAEIKIPGDKSISHRAVIIGALARGVTTIDNFLPSGDCLATVDCFRKMGIEIDEKKQLVVKGKGLQGLSRYPGTMEVGNSGTTMRLLAGVLAGQPFISEMTGDESIQKRPMGRIALPLRLMGASVDGRMVNREIYAPLKIFGGGLKAIQYEMPVASAQVKSAVLLAGLFADGQTTVNEKMASRDHTERMLEHFGAALERQGLTAMVTGHQEFDGAEVDIPGDLSSAAFFLVAGAIIPGAELKLTNVGVNPTRTGIIDVLHRMGAVIEIDNEVIISGEPRAEITVKYSKLKAVKLAGEIIPRIIDEIPIIAAAATQAEGITEIRGARELRIKESDRITTTATELRKMGAKIKELDDGLIIEGPTKLTGAVIDSHGDHRIAMTAAIMGLAAEGETVIENTTCIETSFPGFGRILAGLQ